MNLTEILSKSGLLCTGAIISAAVLGAEAAQAVVLFSDNFDAYNDGQPTENYTFPLDAPWDVGQGVIDLFPEVHGDGSPGLSLKLNPSSQLRLWNSPLEISETESGNLDLNFNINKVNPDSPIRVSMYGTEGLLALDSYNQTGFQTLSIPYAPLTGPIRLSFGQSDNVLDDFSILDDVSLDFSPDSGSSTGGSGTSTGGSGPSTGGSGPSTGGSGPSTGGSGTSTGGSGTSTAGSGTSTGGSGISTGGSGKSVPEPSSTIGLMALMGLGISLYTRKPNSAGAFSDPRD